LARQGFEPFAFLVLEIEVDQLGLDRLEPFAPGSSLPLVRFDHCLDTRVGNLALCGVQCVREEFKGSIGPRWQDQPDLPEILRRSSDPLFRLAHLSQSLPRVLSFWY